jgi:hypothetical protein
MITPATCWYFKLAIFEKGFKKWFGMDQKPTAQTQTTGGAAKHFLLIAPPGTQHSQFVHQVAHTNAKSIGNFDNGINRRRLFAALDFPNVVVVQVRFFRQLFLAHAQRLSANANRFTEDFAIISFRWHQHKRKQEPEKSTTVLRLYFFLLILGGRHRNGREFQK